MLIPSLQQLNDIRKEGFRPGIVACIIFEKKIVLFFKKDYNLWQLPQGRINNKQTVIDSIKTTLKEELGADFIGHLTISDYKIIDVDRMEFKPGKHELEKLFDDDGREINMVGKVYYFCIIESDSPQMDIKKTKYDEFHWMDYHKANFIAQRIYQKGKKRITGNIINKLHDLGIIV
ncbi:hypothetical protein A2V49_03585 [candidate division WWE3 bacterium RBG_19FT_COMBO_34_6]|uniref:Nudix hydrolase domain-containing protein n=1 Tax=candidate division WWE3 bacterium RBG_19FT_COMBO_34_6 TaxID=1802612 RepID=A0A1F4UNH5_UNCKA|nr:MAG: hypothetical protein A2V49_03585 [candidate division WWE3 bacterium RBG_19FT_COMBO_34_6]